MRSRKLCKGNNHNSQPILTNSSTEIHRKTDFIMIYSYKYQWYGSTANSTQRTPYNALFNLGDDDLALAKSSKSLKRASSGFSFLEWGGDVIERFWVWPARLS